MKLINFYFKLFFSTTPGNFLIDNQNIHLNNCYKKWSFKKSSTRQKKVNRFKIWIFILLMKIVSFNKEHSWINNWHIWRGNIYSIDEIVKFEDEWRGFHFEFIVNSLFYVYTVPFCSFKFHLQHLNLRKLVKEAVKFLGYPLLEKFVRRVPAATRPSYLL